MKRLFLLLLAVSLVTSCNQVNPPVAPKHETDVKTCAGILKDNYYWMRLSDEQKSAETPDDQTAEVLNYLKAENNYAESILSKQRSLINDITAELKARIIEDDSSVPYYKNGWYYYTKNEKGKNYPIYYRKKGDVEEIYLDVNELAEGKSFCSITSATISPDNRYLCYSADFIGRRQYTLYVKDLTTGKLLEKSIPNVSYTTEWGADSKTIYYVGKDLITLRADKILRHDISSDNEDEVIYFEEDPTYNIRLSRSADGKYIFLVCDQTLTDEILYLKADDVRGKFKSLTGRVKGVKCSADYNAGYFYLLNDKDGALNNKIDICKENRIGEWKNIIPASDDVLIRNFKLFDNYLVINEEKEANNSLRVVDLKTMESRQITAAEPCYSASIDINEQVDTDILRYNYTSLVTPYKVIEYNMADNSETVLKDVVVPTYDASKYVSERIWATAQDGTQIPISLLYKKGFVKDGKGKVFLYGYGSYGSSSNPRFDADVFSLVERGFVYAVAHIRGGQEMGRKWYEEGKLLKKKNTFTDFNDCARHLIAENYTTSEGMFAYGASAGGLLMGAVINMEPELYKGIIAGVPFVDVINTMQDETVPLTTFEWDEWGDPRGEPYYSYMLSYSPYDNIKAQDYPNILVTSGYWDSQVQYWEPAKWVAKLREFKTDNNQLLFLCDMESGHGGASGRYNRVEKQAKEYTFILMQK